MPIKWNRFRLGIGKGTSLNSRHLTRLRRPMNVTKEIKIGLIKILIKQRYTKVMCFDKGKIPDNNKCSAIVPIHIYSLRHSTLLLFPDTVGKPPPWANSPNFLSTKDHVSVP